MNAETVNAATTAGRTKAESEQLGDLTKIYLRLITAAGRRAAAAFRQSVALIAATDPTWVPPADTLINAEQLTADGKRKTAGPHEQILRTVTAADVIGIDWTIAHPTSQMLLASVASRLDTLNAALRLQVSETIQDGYDQGWSVAQTANAIVAKVDEVAPARAAMYARTDLIALSNGGSLMAAQIAGVAAKSWLTAGDERVRETHADADGQTVPIDQPFDVGGEQAQYPGDPDLSDEESLNCRCTITFNDSLAAALTEPTSPEGARMEPMTETLTALRELVPGLDTLTDAEVMGVHALILAATKKHDYRGNDGEACAVCGEMASADCHYEAATEKLALDVVEMTVTAAADGGPTAWQATLLVEGVPTEDGRLIALGATSWRALPLPLGLMLETPHSDIVEAPVCGRIDEISRAGALVQARGIFNDTADDEELRATGLQAVEAVRDRIVRGVSVDLMVLGDDVIFEPAPKDEEQGDDSGDGAGQDGMDVIVDVDGPVEVVIEEPDGRWIYVVTEGVIGSACVVPVPAIAQGQIQVITADAKHLFEKVNFVTRFTETEALVAAVAPLRPPAEWFDDPKLDRPTPLTIGDDGRVFGHVALWSSCHQGFPGRCVPPPRSSTGYSLFHVGAIKTEEGETLAIGKITLKAPHADVALNSEAARAHYDNTGTVAAFVRAGEDQFGPWVAGALRSDAPEEIVRDLLANPLSGDWRAGEMIAAHAVPAPGFPVLRAAAFDEAGEETETALIMTSPIPLEAEAVEEPMSPLAYLRPGRTRAA